MDMERKLLLTAAALSAAVTMILFSIWLFGGVMGWIQALPQGESRALTPLLLASSGITLAVGATWRHLRDEKKDQRDA